MTSIITKNIEGDPKNPKRNYIGLNQGDDVDKSITKIVIYTDTLFAGEIGACIDNEVDTKMFTNDDFEASVTSWDYEFEYTFSNLTQHLCADPCFNNPDIPICKSALGLFHSDVVLTFNVQVDIHLTHIA